VIGWEVEMRYSRSSLLGRSSALSTTLHAAVTVSVGVERLEGREDVGDIEYHGSVFTDCHLPCH